MELLQRSRRLRGSEVLRRMVRETRIDASSLIYPMFVVEGTGVKEEISSMPGQYRWSLDRLPEKLSRYRNKISQTGFFFNAVAHAVNADRDGRIAEITFATSMDMLSKALAKFIIPDEPATTNSAVIETPAKNP